MKYQIVNRIEGNHLFLNIESHQRVTTRQDISNGQEHIPVRIATDAPEPEVLKLLNSFNPKGKGKRDSKIYIRQPIESSSVCCLFSQTKSSKNAPSHYCNCKSGQECEPSNNKKTNNSCGGKHCQEKEVYHTCNFMCSCSIRRNLSGSGSGQHQNVTPCGGTKALMGLQIPVELFWREQMSEWGLRTLQPIQKGVIVGEYAGLLQSGTNDPTRAKVTTNATKEGTNDDFLSAFACDPQSTTTNDILVELDAKNYCCAMYFMNHECKNFNLKVEQFCDSSRYLELGPNKEAPVPFRRILFVTTKKIKEGTELTFQYQKNGGSGKTKTAFLNGNDCLCTTCCKVRNSNNELEVFGNH